MRMDGGRGRGSAWMKTDIAKAVAATQSGE